MSVGLAYALAATALLVHEVDAVRCREWRLLYVLRSMEEARARRAFILIHWPFSFLLIAPFVAPPGVAEPLAFGIGLFALVHLVLHLRLRNAPENRFSGPLSYAPIWAAALFGGMHCLLAVR